jgi:hypothetical protein
VTGPPTAPAPGRATESRGGVILGVVLIGLGLLFLLDRVIDVDLAGAGWPLFVLVPGLILLAWGSSTRSREAVGVAIAGGITTVVGSILAVQNATDLWATWAYAWALVGPGGTGLGLVAHGLAQRDPGEVRNGWRSIASGVVLFLAFGLFFEGLIGLSFGRPLLTSDLGPVVLIAVGVLVIGIALRRGPRSTP